MSVLSHPGAGVLVGVYFLFISCSPFKKWHEQMLWSSNYSLLSVQGKVGQPEGLFVSPKHPPATWGILQGEADKPNSLAPVSRLVGWELCEDQP